MSYSYEDTTWSDALNIPLEGYDTFEDLENYLGTQPRQTANPYPSSQQLPPTASISAISTWDYNASSSNSHPIPQSSSLPSLSWTSDASSSNFYRSSSYNNPYPSPFTTPLIEDDYTFFANVDLPPLDSNVFNVTTNPQTPWHSPGPEPVVGHVSPSSTKRPHTSEESEYPNNASNDVPFYHKRRKLSINGHQDIPNVPPPTSFHNNSSNVVSDAFDNSNVSIENDNALLANEDSSLLNPSLFIVTPNPSIPHAPKPIGHRSPPSRKRPYANEEPDFYNTSSNPHHERHRRSIDDHKNLSSNLFIVTPNPSMPDGHAPNPVGRHPSSSGKRPYANDEPNFYRAPSNPNPKRPRLSANSHKNSSTIPPPPYSYNVSSDAIPNIVHYYYVPASPAPTLSTNTIPVPQPYPNYNMFHHVSAPFANIPPAPPAATIPPVYAPAAQPGSGAPSRTISYSADSNVYPNVNSYTASGGRNGFPSWDPLSYLTSLQPENEPLNWTTGLPGTENVLNNDATAATSGPSVRNLVPPFLGQQVPRVPYNNVNVSHTRAFANNATHSGVDICQHSKPTHHMSTTDHTANARMPSTRMPPTRAASSAEPVLTFKHYQPPLPSPPIRTSRPAKAPRKRCVPQPLPAMHFWSRTDDGYRCQYDGPAAPNGCKKIIRVTVPSSFKNLGRHMRIHACAEDKMFIPEVEKIALNSLPDSLREKLVTCSLDDGELHHCAYFRDHGRRWEETLERTDNLSRKHDRRNHPPHLWKR